MSRQLLFNDLTGGINNVDTKDKLNSTTRRTETPEMVNVEYLDIGGIKTMDGNQRVGLTDHANQKYPVIAGWEYVKENKKYMLIGLSNGEVRMYNASLDTFNGIKNPFELIYKFPSESKRMSFCNMNNGVVITNGIDDLVFYEININTNVSGSITVEENSNKVYGTNTRFKDELHIGDGIYIGEEVYYIKSIEGNKELTLDTNVAFQRIDFVESFSDMDQENVLEYVGYEFYNNEEEFITPSYLVNISSVNYTGFSTDGEIHVALDGAGYLAYTTNYPIWSINNTKTLYYSSAQGLAYDGDNFIVTGIQLYNGNYSGKSTFINKDIVNHYSETVKNLPSSFSSSTIINRPYYFNDTLYVVGVDTTNHYISTFNYDTQEWNQPTSGTTLATIKCLSIAYGDGKYVALGQDGNISVSNDGLTYNSYEMSSELNSVVTERIFWKTIIYDNVKNIFIAYTSNGHVSTSEDGITWETPKETNIYQSSISTDSNINVNAVNTVDGIYLQRYRVVYRAYSLYDLIFKNNNNNNIELSNIEIYNTEQGKDYKFDGEVIIQSGDIFKIQIGADDFYSGSGYEDDTYFSCKYKTYSNDIITRKSNASLCNATLINTNTDVDPSGNVHIPIRGLAIQYYKGRLYVGTKKGLFYSPIGEYNNWNIQDDAGVFYDIYNDNSEVTALGLYSDYMLVHKKFNTYVLSDSGTSSASESLTINPFSNVTCESQQSWIVSNTKYFVYSKEFMDIYPLVQRTIYNDRFLGVPITEKVRNIFKKLRSEDTENIFCVSRPKERQMIFYLPTEYCGGSNEALIYDFQTKSWLLRRLPKETPVTVAFNFDNNIYVGTENGLVLKEFSGQTFTNLENTIDIEYEYNNYSYTTNNQDITSEEIDSENYLKYNLIVDSSILSNQFVITDDSVKAFGTDWAIKDYDENRKYNIGDSIELIKQYDIIEGSLVNDVNEFKDSVWINKADLISDGEYYKYTFNFREVLRNVNGVYNTGGLFVTKIHAALSIKYPGGHDKTSWIEIDQNEYCKFGYNVTIKIPKGTIDNIPDDYWSGRWWSNGVCNGVSLRYVDTSNIIPNFNNTYLSFNTIVNKKTKGIQGLNAYYKSPWFDWLGNYMQSFAEFIVDLNLDHNNNFCIRTQKDDLYGYEDRQLYNSKINPDSLVYNESNKHWAGINPDTNVEYKDDKWGNGRFCTLRMVLPNNVFEDFQLEFRAIEPYESFFIYEYGFRRIEAEESPW